MKTNKFLPWALIGSMFLVVLIFIAIRALSPEDDWLCQNGKWIEHGSPSAPMPEEECR